MDVMAWIDGVVQQGRGAVTIGYTEAGDIGVFVDGQEKAAGIGDTAEEALRDAVRCSDSSSG